MRSNINKIKDEEVEIVQKREKIRQDIAGFQDLLVLEKTNLNDYRQKRREEQKEKIAAERLLQEAEREKERLRRADLQKKKEERDNERKKQELLEIPYQDEIDLCDKLSNYLESLLPKKVETAHAPAASTASLPTSNFADTPEGSFIKKDNSQSAQNKKNKKQKAVKVSQDLKHNVNVFLEFEHLSLAPPSKVSDLETAIFEVQARKDHYSKLSATKMKERVEAAKALTNGQPKEKEQPEQEKANTTITTTTTTPITKSVTEDGDSEQLQDEGGAPEEEIIIPEVLEV